MFKLLLYLLVHFHSSYGNKCTVANEPALPSDSNQDYCLFSNYSKYELAKAGYKEKKLDVMLDFNVQNTQVDQDLNRWHASVLLSVTWPDHRILLKDGIEKVALPMNIVDQLWLPHLISNSKQILDPDNIIESSLSFSALKGLQSTKIQVLFQPHFFNGCRNMSFWNFPFEKFDCDFFLFIRSLPAESAILSGNITIDQDSQTPSEFSRTYKATSQNTTEFNGQNYSTMGFNVEFARFSLTHLVEYFLPILLFSVACIGSFTIPPLEGNDRTCMLITLFLVMVQMSLYISDNSPNANTTALDVYVSFSILFIFLAVFEYLVVLFLMSKKRLEKYSDEYIDVMEKVRKLDKCSLVLFPVVLILFNLIFAIFYLVSQTTDIKASAVQQFL